jgi:hypothetical protein
VYSAGNTQFAFRNKASEDTAIEAADARNMGRKSIKPPKKWIRESRSRKATDSLLAEGCSRFCGSYDSAEISISTNAVSCLLCNWRRLLIFMEEV